MVDEDLVNIIQRDESSSVHPKIYNYWLFSWTAF